MMADNVASLKEIDSGQVSQGMIINRHSLYASKPKVN